MKTWYRRNKISSTTYTHKKGGGTTRSTSSRTGSSSRVTFTLHRDGRQTRTETFRTSDGSYSRTTKTIISRPKAPKALKFKQNTSKKQKTKTSFKIYKIKPPKQYRIKRTNKRRSRQRYIKPSSQVSDHIIIIILTIIIIFYLFFL